MASHVEDRKQTGSLTASGQSVTISMPASGVVAFQLTGTWVGTISFEVTCDGTNYVSIKASPLTGGVRISTTTTNGIYIVAAAGLREIRARCSAYTSGTIVVTAVASSGALDAIAYT